jgi:hypothetical protein
MTGWIPLVVLQLVRRDFEFSPEIKMWPATGLVRPIVCDLAKGLRTPDVNIVAPVHI